MKCICRTMGIAVNRIVNAEYILSHTRIYSVVKILVAAYSRVDSGVYAVHKNMSSSLLWVECNASYLSFH